MMLWFEGSVILWLLYSAVFLLTARIGSPDAAVSGLANVVPLSILSAGVHTLIKARIMSLSVPAQIGAHAGLSFSFAVTWYALTIVLLTFFDGVRGRGCCDSGG